MNKHNLALVTFVILIIVAARLVPHAPNFSPLASIILFSGVYGQNKKCIILPLLALFISDLFIGFYSWPIMLSVYGSFTLIGLLGTFLKKRRNTVNIITSSLASALLFFLITNLSVWLFTDWYTHNLSGLILCYTLAIPFFRNTVISNLVYSEVLFGGYETFKKLIAARGKISSEKNTS